MTQCHHCLSNLFGFFPPFTLRSAAVWPVKLSLKNVIVPVFTYGYLILDPLMFALSPSFSFYRISPDDCLT